MNRIALLVGAAMGVSAAVAPLAFDPPGARIVYNPSDSVPRGWYRVGPPDSLHVGDIVLGWLPPQAAALAAQREYLPQRIPLLKRIGAMSPQRVCICDRIVRIDGLAQAVVLMADSRGRPLPLWEQCRRLNDGELFLLSATNPTSFDSRYFGPISAAAVIGSAQPLWTWNTP